MVQSKKIIAVLDTNVIYPILCRDILLWFAHYDLFIPKWSKDIFNEWYLVMLRKGVSHEEALKRIQRVNSAFPYANVEFYDELISLLDLPDENDKHVLAVAIKSNANLIITNNGKHFPEKYLESFNVKAKSLDNFLMELIEQNQEKSISAFKEMISIKTKPPVTEFQMLEQLRKIELNGAADSLFKLLEGRE